MNSFNSINAAITGRVGSEPELKTTENGKKFASFRMVVPMRKYDAATQTYTEEVTWLTVSIFGSAVKLVTDREKFKVGREIMVRGKLTSNSWLDTNKETGEQFINSKYEMSATGFSNVERKKKDAPAEAEEAMEAAEAC